MTTLFVGSLSPEVTDSDLRAVFGTYGRATSMRLVSRRGLADVELDPEAAPAAVDALRATQLKGRTVDVVLDRPRLGGPEGAAAKAGDERRPPRFAFTLSGTL